MPAGLAIDETATRLSNTHHLLRELVHRACGWLEHEPVLELKASLVQHLAEDAEALSAVRERLATLETDDAYPGAPGERVRKLLSAIDACASAEEYREAAYGIVKPALVAGMTEFAKQVDPLRDEPLLLVVSGLQHRQQRQIGELVPRDVHPHVSGEIVAQPVDLDAQHALDATAAAATPARDGYLDALPHHEGGCERVHDLMGAELRAAELAARASHQRPGEPWEFHARMTAQAAEAMRNVGACDQLLGELGCVWGNHELGAATTSELLEGAGAPGVEELLAQLAADR